MNHNESYIKKNEGKFLNTWFSSGQTEVDSPTIRVINQMQGEINKMTIRYYEQNT